MPGGELREFNQAILGGRRVDEGDPATGVADARHRVEQRNSLGLQLGQRLVDILDLEADLIFMVVPC